jgi:hypothetical protein
MRAFWVLAAVTLLLQVGMPLVSVKYGPAVKARFVERSKMIPGDHSPELPLTRQTLTDWILQHPTEAAGYASPVLFPLDLLFLISLATALGFGSEWLARHGLFISGLPWWVWWAPPAVYAFADLSEDAMLVVMFKDPDWISPGTFWWLEQSTLLKIGFVIAAGCEFAGAGVLAAARLVLPFR